MNWFKRLFKKKKEYVVFKSFEDFKNLLKGLDNALEAEIDLMPNDANFGADINDNKKNVYMLSDNFYINQSPYGDFGISKNVKYYTNDGKWEPIFNWEIEKY